MTVTAVGTSAPPMDRRARSVGATRPVQRWGRAVALAIVAFGDIVSLVAAFRIAGPGGADAAGFVVGFFLFLVATGAYRSTVDPAALPEARVHALAAGATLLLIGVGQAMMAGAGLGSGIIVFAGMTAVLVPILRFVSYASIRALRRHRRFHDRVLIVGADAVGRAVAAALARRVAHGLEPIGFVDDIDPAGAPAPLLGGLSRLGEVITTQSVDRVIVAFGAHRDEDLVRVLRTTLHRPVDVYVVPRLHPLGIDADSRHVERVGCVPLLRLRRAAPMRLAWPAKRAFDIAVAGAALVIVAPLLAVLAVAVRRSGPGPVLFRQQRVGQHGRVFELLKFRSMAVNDDSDVRWSVASDVRQTGVGQLMRRYSLDELPQLWNVLRGDMSLVGPRPERPHFVEAFNAAVDGYADRHRLPVGLTGWAQVNGLRGDTSIVERARYDNGYIDHWSLLGDLSILVATVGAVLRDGRSKRSA